VPAGVVGSTVASVITSEPTAGALKAGMRERSVTTPGATLAATSANEVGGVASGWSAPDQTVS
jgi:hypothetical protein